MEILCNSAPNGGNYHIRNSGTFLLSSGIIEQRRWSIGSNSASKSLPSDMSILRCFFQIHGCDVGQGTSKLDDSDLNIPMNSLPSTAIILLQSTGLALLQHAHAKRSLLMLSTIHQCCFQWFKILLVSTTICLLLCHMIVYFFLSNPWCVAKSITIGRLCIEPVGLQIEHIRWWL